MDSPELSPAVDTDRASERESAEASPEQKPEAVATKRELRKILREDSNWSMRSITVTALTGVSVAVISTQLNGLVSSFVLIAVMAFITASVSEIYRVFLALTGFGAKRAAAQAAKVLPLPAARSGERGQSAGVDQPAEQDSENPVTEAIEVVTSAYRLNSEQEAQHPGILRRLGYRFRNYGRANPFLWLIVLFIGIAATTVSVAYLVTDGQPPQIIQRTVSVSEELSAQDRAAIVAEAKAQALEELQTQDSSTKQVAPAQPESVSDELKALSDRLTAMETEIDGLSVPATTPAPDTGTDQPLLDRITKLENERDALTKRVAELEAKLAAGIPGAPATTGTVASPGVPSPTR